MSTLIHNVRIFDGEDVITEDGWIFLKDGLIEDIGLESSIPDIHADNIINGKGNTILPGLIDGHVHVHAGISELAQALKFGVTTVLDMFNDPENIANLKKEAAVRADIADVMSSLNGATVKGGWPSQVMLATMEDKELAKQIISTWPQLESPSQAEDYVKSNIAKGADYIKLFQEDGSGLKGDILPVPTPETQAALVAAAHKHGLITLAHALTQSQTMTVLNAGVDGLAHCFCDSSPTAELLAAYEKNRSFCVPALVVVATLTGEEVEGSKELVGRDGVRGLLGEEGRSCFCGRMMMAREGCKIEFAYETVRMLKAGGVDIVAGTDSATGLVGTAIGLSLHQELYLYNKRCGLTPLEALRSATGTTARRFRLKDRGRLVKGWRGDVLMVKGNPTVDLSVTLGIQKVWRSGVALRT